MNRWLLAVLVAAGLSPAWAEAQTVGSYPWRTPSSPTVSPYLNLTRGGNAGINYFSLVRPQVDAQKNFMQLNQELMQMQMQQGMTGAGAGASGLSTGFGATSGFTGRESSVPVFNSVGHFFPMMPSVGPSSLGRR